MDNKLLCVGGSLSGEWRDFCEYFEVDLYDNLLRAEVYKVKQLLNPDTNELQIFFVYEGLLPEKYDYAVRYALDHQN